MLQKNWFVDKKNRKMGSIFKTQENNIQCTYTQKIYIAIFVYNGYYGNTVHTSSYPQTPNPRDISNKPVM